MRRNPTSPDPKEEPENHPIANIVDDKDLSYRPKRKPYSHMYHIPHLPEAEPGIEEYLDSRSRRRGGPRGSGPEQEPELGPEPEPYTPPGADISLEEFIAELEKHPPNPFRDHGTRKKREHMSWRNFKVSSPSTITHTSSIQDDLETSELEGPGNDVDSNDDNSIHSGLQLSQYEIDSLISQTMNEDDEFFGLPKPATDKGTGTTDKGTGTTDKGTGTTDKGTGTTDKGTGTTDKGTGIQQEDLEVDQQETVFNNENAGEGSLCLDTSISDSEGPSPLGSCCEDCGAKGSIALSTGRGGSAIRGGRRAEIIAEVQKEKRCEHGGESWMMCSECCTCGSHSGQLVMPGVKEGIPETLRDLDGEEENTKIAEREQVGAVAGRVKEVEDTRPSKKTKGSPKWDPTYMGNMVLGKGVQADDDVDVEAEERRDHVGERHLDQVSLAAAAMVVLIAVQWWLERRGAVSSDLTQAMSL
jgi:hypothetical protein